MSLTAGLKTPRDMLAKLQREHTRLKDEVTADDLMNFAITGYHIIEWIRKNDSVNSAAKQDLDSMYRSPLIGACRDIANETKHFVLKKNYPDRVTEKTSATSGNGEGRYGKGAFGVGEPSIVIVFIDGTRFDVLQFAQGVVEAWEAFFRSHGL